MKFFSPAPVLVTILLAAGLGYAVGRFYFPQLQRGLPGIDRAGSEAAGELRRVPAPDAKFDASLISLQLGRLLPPESLTDSRIGETTFRSLEEPDRTRRMAAVGILVESMTPANAETVREAFVQCTLRTGRRHDSEWSMMMRQYGKVLGPAAWARLKENGSGSGDRASAMEGWATADPAAALAALGHDDPHYDQLRPAVLSGITQKDPEMGFRLALEDPSGINPAWLIESGIQTLGLDGATAALQHAIDTGGQDVAERPGVGLLFVGLSEAMFHQKWTAGESEKMLPWLEAQKDQPFLTDATVNHGAKDVVLQGKLEVALDWLDRMNAGREGHPRGAAGLMQGLIQKPGLLSGMEGGTLDRIVALAPLSNWRTWQLAAALEITSPAHAERLRALPPDPRGARQFDPSQ